MLEGSRQCCVGRLSVSMRAVAWKVKKTRKDGALSGCSPTMATSKSGAQDGACA